MHGRRVALGILGSVLVTIGVAFLVPFSQKLVDGQSVRLWPTPLFVIPLVVLAFGVAIVIGLVITREPNADAHALDADALIRQRILEWLEVNIELSKREVQERTNAESETVERVVAGLRAEGRIRLRSTAKGQMITRRETVYDETGQIAGVETVYEDGRRDAAPMPGPVQAKADVPSPTVLTGQDVRVRVHLNPLFGSLRIDRVTLDDPNATSCDMYRIPVSLGRSDNRAPVDVCASLMFEWAREPRVFRGLWSSAVRPVPECARMRRDGEQHDLDILMVFPANSNAQQFHLPYWRDGGQASIPLLREQYDFQLDLYADDLGPHESLWSLKPDPSGGWSVRATT